MKTNEPILSHEDLVIWDLWQRTAEVHSCTQAYKRRVDSASVLIEQALSETPNAALSWSGGKDSTVMTHLVCVRLGHSLPVFSIKDDLDFPGEEEYIRNLSGQWGLDLNVIHPAISPKEWLKQNVANIRLSEDIHSRAAGLSKECFYSLLEDANRPYDAIMLGLRSEESKARRRVRQFKGRYYQLNSGKHRVLPIADWTGLDVFAYAFKHQIELLPVYKCVALMHEHKPWTLRKSWWLPGSSMRFGQMTWLRRYYPSLHMELEALIPGAVQFS